MNAIKQTIKSFRRKNEVENFYFLSERKVKIGCEDKIYDSQKSLTLRTNYQPEWQKKSRNR
jgi:hypothetical protein